MAKEKARPNPVKITDTTFRDGHQSLFATRMRLEDMLPIVEEMDKVGFHSLEVWGGATFDVCSRFLNEDPWERLATLKKHIRKTPLQMLLRGQNLVGYRNYADDVVEAFVKQAADIGMDIFRVFDALNDERNFLTSFRVIRACGKHIQGTICYSLTERRLGGPVFPIEYYVKKAKILEEMGADSLCVKDMAGLIAPEDAYDLVKALKETVKIPIQLHTHYTSGMASMSYLKAIEAGLDIIDTALAPFALRSSQPAIEPIVVALSGSARDTGLDLAKLFQLGQHLEKIAPKYRHLLDSTKMAVIDTGVLVHQIPGGMFSNLVSQLKEQDALDRIQEVYEELPRTRKDMGFPPLVTPTSQIVGIQAVQNVLFGRYKMISGQVKDYAYGLYGKPPVPMDPDVQRLCLKGYERGETPITCRAADLLPPEMEKAREATQGLARDERDVLTYALYPTTGLRFLKWKYGVEPPPAEVRPKTLEEVKREDEIIAKALAGKLVEKEAALDGKQAAAKKREEAGEPGPGARTFKVWVDGEAYEVQVEDAAGSPVLTRIERKAPAATALPKPAPAPTPKTSVAAATAPTPTPPAARDEKEVSAGETAIRAPMPGMVISWCVNVGDKVKEGDVVVVLEAMKMQNSLPATASGTVKEIRAQTGDKVAKNQILAVIG